MLGLIARGVHLEQPSQKPFEPLGMIHRDAYENFYTLLNDAVNLKDYTQDIHKKEVTRMLDQMLADRKGVVGRGGLAERQPMPRMTRSLRMAWNRAPAIGFDGSLSEWNQGRKVKVLRSWKLENERRKERAMQKSKIQRGSVKNSGGKGDSPKSASARAGLQ